MASSEVRVGDDKARTARSIPRAAGPMRKLHGCRSVRAVGAAAGMRYSAPMQNEHLSRLQRWSAVPTVGDRLLHVVPASTRKSGSPRRRRKKSGALRRLQSLSGRIAAGAARRRGVMRVR